ncbi:hypothetical protein [Paraburkholderia sp. CI3]
MPKIDGIGRAHAAPRLTTTLPGCTRPSLIAAIESSDVEKRIASPVNARC